MNLKSTLLTAAVGGILAGVTGCAGGGTPQPTAPSATEAAPAGAPAAAPAKHGCKGQNDCKGHGGCKTDTHACKGQNDCKGQGGCHG